MTTTLSLREIERFLFTEARLADEHDYAAWEALWTDDAVYWVPAGGADTDPRTQMSIVYDNRNRIATRIKQLQTGKRHSQSPPSRMRRLLTNIEVRGQEGADTVVEANFLLAENRERGNTLWAGRVTYRLREVDGVLRLAYKKVVLIDSADALPTLSFLI